MSTEEDRIIYTGDLEPPLRITLSGKTAVDTTAVPNRLVGYRGGTIVIDEILTDKVVVGDTTVVTYPWQDGDTDTPGPIYFEVEVEWTPNRGQTFPGCNKVLVRRDADL